VASLISVGEGARSGLLALSSDECQRCRPIPPDRQGL